ncbi:yjeF-like protein, hydroxyethylthiazole kinase-related [Candidatus Methanoperedens nitroreducens]|uniref:Bifunctional NAD(P)H-hydrate repair enzyme n=1 Tax=Candidatus Methanoperedens nitratireducens TaxID=1392998 RepID=A0A062V7I5_9EURY|nr:bifunctional ADP-dependent NAD(P)H-hydrate dehydratase/NAD(P)H-hydrate epimerase [Candidatus Methanoperedens nitroreducens]KCZ73267.1 yjeF-like protein, hydroxyethylthiazole kinase-related [Candidatus Methanoperedens nitroreducens]MDJ1422785.1 bifunctional ADP-dependent NAD(P)H-hydrate dehydratase/NAD(P)H-hydrate epimerase [Candidatus Methanoperedens sp.]
MEAITSSRMAAIDANCEYLGIKRLQLMENAGAAVAHAIKKRITSGRIVIIAGRGNNGGDAFVAARHLCDYDTTVILIGRKEGIKTQEARHNWNILEKTSIPLIQITDSTMLDTSLVKNADIIIDGIFGTGIKGKISEPESTAIDIINESGSQIVSVDVPSGFDPDGGEFEKSVRADLTLTFHRMKVGLLAGGAGKYTGEIQVVDIGIPREAELFVGPGDIQPFLRRAPSSHKGDAGRVLIIGGGAYSGAPALCAMGALRAGADIVTVATPENVSGIIASFSPNLIVRQLSGDRLVENDIPLISDLIRRHDVVVIGMGLGTAEDTIRAVTKIVPLCRKAVIDADALGPFLRPLLHKNIIITPHAGEMKRLSGADVPEDEKEKISFIKNFARDNNVTVLLKGVIDIISDGSEVRASRTGNAGMTVGGTGDVLAGLTGALFAKHDALEAASAAAFINGAAGDMAFEEFGYGLLATDVIDYITEVMYERDSG